MIDVCFRTMMYIIQQTEQIPTGLSQLGVGVGGADKYLYYIKAVAVPDWLNVQNATMSF